MGANKSKYQSDPWEPDVDKSSKVEQSAADDYTKVYGGSPHHSTGESKATSSKVIDGQKMWGTEDDNGGWLSDDGTVYVTKSGTIEHGRSDPAPVTPGMSLGGATAAKTPLRIFHKDASTVGMRTIPTVSMAYTTAPDLIPTEAPNSGDGDTPPPLPDYGSLTVNLGELRAAEQTFLDSTATILTHYEALHTRVTAAINNPNLFGQNVGSWSGSYGDHSGFGEPVGRSWTAGENADGGAQTAATTNLQMIQTLQSIAGLAETMGVFTALLNNTGQIYTETDAKQVIL